MAQGSNAGKPFARTANGGVQAAAKLAENGSPAGALGAGGARPLEDAQTIDDARFTARRPIIAARIDILRALRQEGYAFVTVTPSTHRRLLRREGARPGSSLRDLLGWSRPVDPAALPPQWPGRLRRAGLLRDNDDGTVSATVRVASLDGRLFFHSAFPPAQEDAVFFGPDTYRFARLLEQALADAPPVARLVDVGAGSGAGAVVAARLAGAARVLLLDVSAKALRMAKVNLGAAGLEADYRLSDGLAALTGTADLIIANPPFIAGSGDRTYRDGGDMHGARLSLDWALDGAARLERGGRFVLYTGSAIVDGRDGLREALTKTLDPGRYAVSYRELDPDIFGGQISRPGYEGVERIAAVGAVISRLGK